MYEGEWRHGKTTGRGKFSWPSGATYEGEFKAGFMDGIGTYTGSSGDTYRGGWSMNLKHGSGRKSYANGDYYDGDWRSGTQDGHGRYIWRNGTEYTGQWRAGLLHGKGSLVFANGNRYDGGWEDGIPCGNGTFRWADGSLYVGIWSKDDAENKGIYYPSPAATSPTARDPQQAFAAELPECRICPGETVSILPSQKTVNWSGLEQAGSKPPLRPRRRASVDAAAGAAGGPTRRPNGRTKTVIGLNSNGEGERGFEKICIWESDGDITCDIVDGSSVVGGGGWEDVDDVMAGRRSVDVDPRVFRTPAPQQLGIRHAVGKQSMASSDLKASAFDPKEKVLLRMLPAYYNHVRNYENTLVTKFFGLHCVKLTGATQKKVRFVIMGNLFCSEFAVHRRFDLKGSSHGRTTTKPESEIDEYTTLKDLDLNFIFRLQGSLFQEFQRQVEKDCEFLEAERIMDYSLLVGVHFRGPSNGEIGSKKEAPPHLSRAVMDQFLYDPARLAMSRLGVNMPARAELTVRKNDCEPQLIGEPTGEFYDVVLIFGIIDILQDYDISKKLEHAYKSIQYDPTSISAVDPKQYAKRFRDFIFKAFTEHT
ncbi:hypothetical protein COCNU_02G017940 [Cocos nucifera]|uniref:1-phosphatidylinositol-4-phosphate 5-kinase n=1 Tax=Cocos nucifera TaxID=13894 RepID=A0A8K0I0T2_COCNU|nr:hypothetical protein COCNU_02G017940 [Cocos nucifera]